MLDGMSEPKQRMVVYGAGGHGRVVADAASAAGFEILGFLDDALPVGQKVLTWQVLGTVHWLEGKDNVRVAHGIGSNHVRQRVTENLALKGLSFVSVIHPSAVLSKHTRVGVGAVVLALAVLNPGAELGLGAIVNTGAVVEHDVLVGDFAHVAPNATLGGGARIDRLALLGTGASVLPGRSIGERSVVGAGAVVARDIPSGCVAAGVPARVIRQIEES
jgi:sugar O-acyltransferase (sialic acid O-acetyltransferase NeuD family)